MPFDGIGLGKQFATDSGQGVSDEHGQKIINNKSPWAHVGPRIV